MRQMRLAGSLALVVTGVLLMPDPLLAQGQESVCRSHPKERPRSGRPCRAEVVREKWPMTIQCSIFVTFADALWRGETWIDD
jgi:hypothetical protein